MWRIAIYQATSLFSLRPYNATTSGGKSLITPTPFATKMALLDVAIRVYGLERGSAWFPQLRDLQVAIQLPHHLMVNNTFIKILRPFKGGKPRDVFGTGLAGPRGNTIAYREQVYFSGDIQLAVRDGGGQDNMPPLTDLLVQVNYLGKRGGFIQCKQVAQAETLPAEFTLLNPVPGGAFSIHGLMQMLDDCGPEMLFEHADVYRGTSTLGINKPNGRVVQPIILPYRPIKSSRSFTLYERIE